MAETDDVPDPDEHVLTVTEVARIFRVQPRTITYWCEAGRIKSYKTPGGHRRIPMSEVMKYVRATNGIRVLGDDGRA